jgi:hypothetical protein
VFGPIVSAVEMSVTPEMSSTNPIQSNLAMSLHCANSIPFLFRLNAKDGSSLILGLRNTDIAGTVKTAAAQTNTSTTATYVNPVRQLNFKLTNPLPILPNTIAIGFPVAKKNANATFLRRPGISYAALRMATAIGTWTAQRPPMKAKTMSR